MAGETPPNAGGGNGVASRVSRVVAHFGRRRVAAAIGISPETVRRYESGTTPNLRFLRGVVDGLGVSAEWMILGSGPLLEVERRREMVARAPLAETLGELMRRALEPEASPGGARRAAGRDEHHAPIARLPGAVVVNGRGARRR